MHKHNSYWKQRTMIAAGCYFCACTGFDIIMELLWIVPNSLQPNYPQYSLLIMIINIGSGVLT
jgi:hypothetical protein